MHVSTPSMQQHILGPALALSLWSWAFHVFEPARRLKRLGLYRPSSLGSLTVSQPHAPGHDAPLLSAQFSEPVVPEQNPQHYDSVTEFDNCSGDYHAAVSPFSDPIYEETVQLMQPFLNPQSRILDPSCGPGNTAVRLAKLVPQGEVVGADLSRGMVERAQQNAVA